MSDQFCYLFNMEAQEGQNAKENETLHVPTWNKVVKKERIVLKLVERWSSKMRSFRKIYTTESVIWIF